MNRIGFSKGVAGKSISNRFWTLKQRLNAQAKLFPPTFVCYTLFGQCQKGVGSAEVTALKSLQGADLFR
jgi:hypothetical protein